MKKFLIILAIIFAVLLIIAFSLFSWVKGTYNTIVTMDGTDIVVSDGKETDSKITINKAASLMNINAGVYVYDFQQTLAAGTVKTYLYGTFTVNEDVTVVS